MTKGNYRAHDVRRESRAMGTGDGATGETIVLTSALPLGPVARRTTDWLDHWAIEAPDRVFLAERPFEEPNAGANTGWRTLTYGDASTQARAIAAALAERGMNAQTPILIISGNGIDHALLTLAAQYIGVPTVPVAEQYALIAGAHPVLTRLARMIGPRMVFADDGARYGAALALPVFDGVERVVSRGATDAMTGFDSLLDGSGDIAALNAAVGPDTVAKYLLTSGSTSHPKGVVTTQRMMCTNQAQLRACLPFVAARPPVLLDWLPWNHVFGGSHNFNLVLSNGGTLHIDDGKPIPALAERTLRNLREVSPTIAFNVPIGFAMLRDAMKDDAALRRQYFRDLDMLFYAGASLPPDVWADLAAMAREECRDMPLITTSWGLTETAPAAVIQHQPIDGAGIIGVPLPGVSLKLVPIDEGGARFEARVKGDTVTPGYLKDAEKTAEAFDEDGYFITGDAMRFVDPADPNRGMMFDGRIAEEFKLSTGTWVRAGDLRLEVLGRLKGLAADVVIAGADRREIGVLIVPTDALRTGARDADGALVVARAEEIAQRLKPDAGAGSARAIRRALVLRDPPSMAAGEVTAKGNLNFRKLLTERAALLERLYRDDDPATIRV